MTDFTPEPRSHAPRGLLACGAALVVAAGAFALYPPTPVEAEHAPLAESPPPPVRAAPAPLPREAPPPSTAPGRRLRERAWSALAAPPPAGQSQAAGEPLPVPDPVRHARLMEEAVREGALADPRHASEETHPLSRFTPEQLQVLYARLQRASNEVAWYQRHARELQARLAALPREEGAAAAHEALEVRLLHTERAAAGRRDWLAWMAPKLAAARLPPPPPAQEGWVPPPSPGHSHADEHEHTPAPDAPGPDGLGMDDHAP